MYETIIMFLFLKVLPLTSFDHLSCAVVAELTFQEQNKYHYLVPACTEFRQMCNIINQFPLF